MIFAALIDLNRNLTSRKRDHNLRLLRQPREKSRRGLDGLSRSAILMTRSLGRTLLRWRRSASPTATPSCCFAGRPSSSRGTKLRSASAKSPAGLSRRVPAAEAGGAAAAVQGRPRRKAACGGHGGGSERAEALPGLMPEAAPASAGATEQLSRTLSAAEQRRKSRPVTSRRCVATLRQKKRVGASNVSFVFALAEAERSDFRFKPGQAVDIFVPAAGGSDGELEARAGSYSIASTPKRLAENGEIELIVGGGGRGAPTRWLHEDARVGDAVELCAVGCFHFASVAEDGPGPLLLIAGGLGINPLYSILAHSREAAAAAAAVGQAHDAPAITLLYSASTADELTHRRSIEAIAAASAASNVSVVFTLTKGGVGDGSGTGKAELADEDGGDADSSSEGSEGDAADVNVAQAPMGAAGVVPRRGRICAALLSEAIEDLTRRHSSAANNDLFMEVEEIDSDGMGVNTVRDLRCYICGPREMTDSVAAMVAEQGVQDTNIHYEKWW